MELAIMLPLLGAVVRIGGMFFAYLALRPTAVGRATESAPRWP